MEIINKGRIVKLIADEGKRLTNKDRSFFSEYLYLAKNDSPENYEEVGKEIWGVFEKDTRIESIIETNEKQDEAIDTTMVALMDTIDTSDNQDDAIDRTIVAVSEVVDIVFELIDQLTAGFGMYGVNPYNTVINKYNKGDETMVEFYVVAIQRGLRTIEQVPTRYREQVEKMLKELEG